MMLLPVELLARLVALLLLETEPTFKLLWYRRSVVVVAERFGGVVCCWQDRILLFSLVHD